MAEAPSGEKVFPATPRKREEARKHGQVAKSMELGGALVLVAVLCWIKWAMSSGLAMNELIGDFQTAFRFDPHPVSLTIGSTMEMCRIAMVWGLRLALPGLICAVSLGVLANVAQVGLKFTPEALTPKFDKLNPMNGFKRMMSRHGLVEVLKGLTKIGIIGWVCYSCVMDQLPLLLSASQTNLANYLSAIGALMWIIGLRVGVILIIISGIDYAYQKYEYEKNLKMTHSEMKQEMKNTEGDPTVKARIRKRQRAISQRRMMQQVPKADVVITNPTHFAVALQYNKQMGAPRVIAKGQDFIAMQIKKVASESGVPMVENVALARRLYAEVPLDREVPADMYKAIAEVLAFVYRTYKNRKPATAN